MPSLDVRPPRGPAAERWLRTLVPLPSSPEWSILLDALILLDNKDGGLNKNEQNTHDRVRHQIKTEIV